MNEVLAGFDSLPDYVVYGVIPYAIFVVLYFGCGFGFLMLDFVPSVRVQLKAYKCQPEYQPTWADVSKILWTTVPQIVVLYPLGVAMGMPVLKGLPRAVAELPTLAEAAVSVPVFALCSEIWFYYNHRFLHVYAYEMIHKKHHEFKAPIALECVYFHPVESLLNFGVVVLGPLLLRSHIVMVYFWSLIATLNILFHHSGYELPMDGVPGFLNSMAFFHDYHHENFSKAFGVIGLMDWVHDSGYREYQAHYNKRRKIKK